MRPKTPGTSALLAPPLSGGGLRSSSRRPVGRRGYPRSDTVSPAGSRLAPPVPPTAGLAAGRRVVPKTGFRTDVRNRPYVYQPFGFVSKVFADNAAFAGTIFSGGAWMRGFSRCRTRRSRPSQVCHSERNPAGGRMRRRISVALPRTHLVHVGRGLAPAELLCTFRPGQTSPASPAVGGTGGASCGVKMCVLPCGLNGHQ